jgi:hypothetical protein
MSSLQAVIYIGDLKMERKCAWRDIARMFSCFTKKVLQFPILADRYCQVSGWIHKVIRPFANRMTS